MGFVFGTHEWRNSHSNSNLRTLEIRHHLGPKLIRLLCARTLCSSSPYSAQWHGQIIQIGVFSSHHRNAKIHKQNKNRPFHRNVSYIRTFAFRRGINFRTMLHVFRWLRVERGKNNASESVWLTWRHKYHDSREKSFTLMLHRLYSWSITTSGL